MIKGFIYLAIDPSEGGTVLAKVDDASRGPVAPSCQMKQGLLSSPA